MIFDREGNEQGKRTGHDGHYGMSREVSRNMHIHMAAET